MAETYVVVRLLPFHCATDPDTKLDPFKVSVNPAPPALADVGLMLDRDGVGFGCELIVNVAAPDAPPPGAGEKTVTLAVPAEAMFEAGTEAVN